MLVKYAFTVMSTEWWYHFGKMMKLTILSCNPYAQPFFVHKFLELGQRRYKGQLSYTDKCVDPHTS